MAVEIMEDDEGEGVERKTVSQETSDLQPARDSSEEGWQ